VKRLRNGAKAEPAHPEGVKRLRNGAKAEFLPWFLLC
jgi:hypothetical protein